MGLGVPNSWDTTGSWGRSPWGRALMDFLFPTPGALYPRHHMAPLHRQNTSPLGKKSLDNDTPRDHNKPRATPATRAPGLVERARAAASSLFKESEEEDTGYRRPRLAGLYAEDLKHEDFTASYEVVKGDSELLSMVLVADGHGGPVTSSWLAENVLQIVGEECVDGTAKEVQAACIRAFSRAHEAVKGLKGPSRDGVEKSSPNNSGSTLTVLVFNHKRREITSANVGDSEALLAHDHGYEELSVSHRLADNPDEQERLTQKGISLGRAIDAEGWPGGPLRAWPGGLAVTRGIGDQDCEEIVSCLPSLKTVPAPSNGGVIVCCSDGVWDAVSLSEAAKMLSSFQVTLVQNPTLTRARALLDAPRELRKRRPGSQLGQPRNVPILTANPDAPPQNLPRRSSNLRPQRRRSSFGKRSTASVSSTTCQLRCCSSMPPIPTPRSHLSQTG